MYIDYSWMSVIKATCSTHYNTNNEYGKYYPGAAARPEYGSVFRVSLPITGLLSSWSLDNYMYTLFINALTIIIIIDLFLTKAIIVQVIAMPILLYVKMI